MTSLMQLLMDFTCTERLPRCLDHEAYNTSKILEDSRSLELEAMFLAAFSVARELR